MIEFNSIDEFRSLVLSIVRPMLMSSVLFTGEASAHDPGTNSYTVIPDDPLLPQMTHVKMVGGIDFPSLSGPVLCCFDSRRNAWIIGPDESAVTSVGHFAVLGDKLVAWADSLVQSIANHTHVTTLAVSGASATGLTNPPTTGTQATPVPIVFPSLTGALSNTETVKE